MCIFKARFPAVHKCNPHSNNTHLWCTPWCPERTQKRVIAFVYSGTQKWYPQILCFPPLFSRQDIAPGLSESHATAWRCYLHSMKMLCKCRCTWSFFFLFNFKDYIAYGHCRKQSWFLTCWTLLLMACICVCVWTAVNKALHFRASARLA